MKRIIKLSVILLLIFFSCSNNDELTNNTIVYQNNDVVITLIGLNDGRCPSNVACVWQGNAEVNLNISNGIESENFTVHTFGNNQLPSIVSILGIEIELLDVQPYPETDITYSLDDYTISLRVN